LTRIGSSSLVDPDGRTADLEIFSMLAQHCPTKRSTKTRFLAVGFIGFISSVCVVLSGFVDSYNAKLGLRKAKIKFNRQKCVDWCEEMMIALFTGTH